MNRHGWLSLTIFAALLASMIIGYRPTDGAEKTPFRERLSSVQSRPVSIASLTPAFLMKDIPDVIQMNDSSCGVGVFQAAAMYFGHWGYQEEFARSLGTTPAQGTHPSRLVKGLQELGLDARMVEHYSLEAMKEDLRQGRVVIIDYQAWGDTAGKDYSKEWEDGHYSILIGFNDQAIFIEDPSLLGTRGYLTNEEFLTRWHDYEIENGKRREYNQMAIIVKGGEVRQPEFSHID